MKRAVGRFVVGSVSVLLGAVAWPASAASVADGKFTLDFHFQYFPTAADLASLRTQVQRARLQLCDATDGAVKVTRIRLTVGDGSERLGDVLLYPPGRTSHADFLGGYAYLFAEGGTAASGFLYTGGTIAHELGHSLLGLGDNYRRDVNINNALCGHGPSFDPGSFTNVDNSIMLDSASICRLPDGRGIDEINPNWRTLCATAGTCGVCTACPGADAGAMLTCEPSPSLASEISVDVNFDVLSGDCATPPCQNFCPVPRPATHLFVTATFDQMATQPPPVPPPGCGNGILEVDEQCDPAQDPADPNTPVRPLCTEFGLSPFSGDRVGCAPNCTFGKGACQASGPTDSCAHTAGLPEACPSDSSPDPAATCETYGLVGGDLTFCLQCSAELSRCTTPPLCGDGNVDPDEQCDLGARNGTADPARDAVGQPVTCEPFYGLYGRSAFLRCNTNCSFNKGPCNTQCARTEGLPESCSMEPGKAVPPTTCAAEGFSRGSAHCVGCSLDLSQCGAGGFDASSWEAARTSATTNSGSLLVVDQVGTVRRLQMFALRVDDERWQVDVLGLGEDYAGGQFGVPVHARTFHVTFDAAASTVATVASGTGPAVPGTTGSMVLGGAVTDGTGGGTPPFTASGTAGQSGPLAITVDFSEVRSTKWLRYNDAPNAPTGSTRFLSGTVVASGPTRDSKVISRCDDPTKCDVMWNSAQPAGGGLIGSWEGSQHRHDILHHPVYEAARTNGQLAGVPSEWKVLAHNLQEKYGITVSPPAPRPLAEPPSETDCGGPLEWDDAAVTTLAPDGIVLVIDRSGSMLTPINSAELEAPSDPGTLETRMGFAQAAARDFLDFVVARGVSGPKTGLVSFSSDATIDQTIAQVVTGSPGAEQVGLGAFKNIINTRVAGGRTAIGVALAKAGELFEGTTFMQKTIILLSDGQNNEPVPLEPFNPTVIARDLWAFKGIRIFTIPTGLLADRELLATIAGIAQGAMFDAPGGDELPAVYAEAFAMATGEALNLHRTPISVPGSDRCDTGEFGCPGGINEVETAFGCLCLPPGESIPIRTQAIPVETGAEKLNVLLSVRNAEIATWNPQFRLTDPNGAVVFAETSPGINLDSFYRILSVPNPIAGTWTLSIAALDLPDQHQFVQAHVEGAGTDCRARVSKGAVSGSESIVLSARPYHAGLPVAGAIVTAELVRPDGSSIPLLTEADGHGEHQLTINPAFYGGRGIHSVRVGCFVPSNASLVVGEDVTIPDPGSDTSRPPAFTKFTTAAFFVDTTAQPPLPPGGDCDQNGIPDTQESNADTDGDGLFDVCDEDDDGDDNPDGTDPDPKNPMCSVPACPIANAGPDQIVQCNAPNTAGATLDGRGSSDADGQSLTFTWTSSVPLQNANQSVATGTFPLGTTAATLTVSDGPNFATDGTLVTVLDTAPPTLTPPPDIATPTCTGVNIGQATAVDTCGGAVTIVNDAPASFKAGTRVVTWRAIDRFGNVAVATQTVVIGLGNDKNCCPAGTKLKLGTSNNDTLTGTSSSDCIIGFGAQDVIKGLGGNDFLSGGDGDDIVEGADGNDQVEGGTGQDTLRGGNGVDALVGFDGDDQCFGGPQDDRIHGGQGQDKLYGEDGNDRLFGEIGDDRLEGGAGNDLLNGGLLHDLCIGGTGTNTFVLCETQQ